MNVGTFLTRRAVLSPHALGAVDGSRRATFAELEARTVEAAHFLSGLGVRTGSRVGVLLPNSLEWMQAFFAVARLGGIIVPLNWRLTPQELAVICADAGAQMLIHTQGTDLGRDLAARHPFQYLIEPDWENPWTAEPGQAPAGSAPTPTSIPRERAAGGAEPLLIAYTSGTTGRPKGAVHSHASWFWAAATVAFSLDVRPGDRALVMMPMYHVGGLIMTTLHVQSGVASVMMRTFDPPTMLQMIADERIAHFLCVPTMLQAVRGLESFPRADFASVRWCLGVGAPLPVTLIEAFAQRGLLVQQAYGLTETGGPATLVPREAALTKAGSAGVPFFHTEVQVVDDAGRPVPPGATGEVVIRGPHVIEEYWDNPEATASAVRGGWLYTGDIGRLDADGYLFLVDRKHDLIITGGENVYPAEIEQVLAGHPGILDAAVFSLPDETWGEVVCAAIVPRSDRRGGDPDVIEFCRAHLAGYKVPRRLFTIGEVPRTPTGKALRRELRARLMRDGGAGAG